jgi:hypothetical protein
MAYQLQGHHSVSYNSRLYGLLGGEAIKIHLDLHDFMRDIGFTLI